MNILVLFGGDEFIVVSIADSFDDGMERTNALREHIDKSVTASTGYVFGYARNDEELKVLIEQADRRMYENKIMRKKARSTN